MTKAIELHKNLERDISCLVMGLSDNAFKSIKTEIQQFRKRLIKIAQDNKEPVNRVYHVNFQIAPTCQKVEI